MTDRTLPPVEPFWEGDMATFHYRYQWNIPVAFRQGTDRVLSRFRRPFQRCVGIRYRQHSGMEYPFRFGTPMEGFHRKGFKVVSEGFQIPFHGTVPVSIRHPVAKADMGVCKRVSMVPRGTVLEPFRNGTGTFLGNVPLWHVVREGIGRVF